VLVFKEMCCELIGPKICVKLRNVDYSRTPGYRSLIIYMIGSRPGLAIG